MKKNIHSKFIPLFLLLFLSFDFTVQGQTQINNLCFNGAIGAGVNAIAKAPDGSIFLGGSFTNIADYCGRAVKFETNNSPSFNPSDPKFEGGAVQAIVPIPGGGWYVGGSFSHYGGIARHGLARINADGSLHEFSLPYQVAISSMIVDSSGKLYAAGFFGEPFTTSIVCFNPDGTVHRTYPGFNNQINSIALDNQGNLYAGGSFTTPRNRLAKFNAAGVLDPFSHVFNTGNVFSIGITSTGEVLAGGQFATVNGVARSNFAKFNADGSLNSFNPAFNSSVFAIAVDGSDNFYAGGNFTNFTERNYLLKFNANGTLNSFNPDMTASVNALRLDGSDALYAGGTFTGVISASSTRIYLAKFNPDGSLNGFTPPRLNNTVNVLAVNESGVVFVGGNFTGINAVGRNRLAKLNPDGTLNAFSINVGGTIRALAFDGLGNLYVGGDFTSIAGQSRKCFAKFNPNLTLNAFNPITAADFTSSISALATDSANNIYIGGFTYFKKYSATGTQLLNPLTFGGFVNAIVVDSQDNAYIAGGFSEINFVERNSFAKFNANGTLASPNSAINGTVYAMALDNSNNIYVGGAFTTVNGEIRNKFAKINPDGTLNPFNPSLDGEVRQITNGPTGNLYIGGFFYSVLGVYRNGFAKLNPNGTLNAMTINGGIVSSVLINGSKLHVSNGYRNYQVYINGDSNCDLSLSNPVPASRCGAGTVTLSITPSSGTVNWYDAPVNGNLVGAGATFTTPSISSTAIYFAEAVDGDCISFARTPVKATILNCRSANLKLFIQSYYTGAGSMNAVGLNQGVEGSTAQDVEPVTVELRHTTTYDLVDTVQAMLHTNGEANCNFQTAPDGMYYLAVKGRSLLQTWSANPVSISNVPVIYDFTTAANKAYGNNMIELESGVFGFYSGDINQDEAIDASDLVEITNDADASAYGELVTDLNGDGSVDNSDLPILVNNAEFSIFCNRPN